MSLSGGGEDHGGGVRGRNEKYNNDEDNGEDRIHVRRKVIDVGSVVKGLGDQQRQLPNNKDKAKAKEKDKDGHPSPPPSKGAYI